MYVCICNAVTEKHIEQAVQQGARRMRDLRHGLGVTRCCSNCAQCAKQCLDTALGNARAAADADNREHAASLPLPEHAISIPAFEMQAESR